MPRPGRTHLFVLLVAAALTPARAFAVEEGPRFGLPVDCEMGTLCVVQNFVDMDPSEQARDHLCGPLTYDGHRGIDIRTATLVEMRAGVPVVAAADGVVTSLSDGMEDVSMNDIDPETIKGRNAGNRVVLDHGDGWTTYYAHLRKGSVAVERGQRVKAGEKLGLIGLSGRTEFPHVEFGVLHRGSRVDPYSGRAAGSGCGKSRRSLWSEEARQKLIYRPGGLLVAGFSHRIPDSTAELLDGKHRSRTLPPDSPALVFWAFAWGVREGDREMLRIIAPDGRVLLELPGKLEKDQAQKWRAGGKKLRGNAWPKGTYLGTYRLERDEDGITRTVIDVRRELKVE